MEKAEVWVIVDARDPISVGQVTSEPGGDGLVSIHLPEEVPYADQVKLVDATDRGLFPPDSTADGYDVDAVAACVCGERAVATEVVDYKQGKRRDGKPIRRSERIDPRAALGEIDGEFYSLGFRSNGDGYVEVGFGNWIHNGPGANITVKEVTENRHGYPPEEAKVIVIDEKGVWHDVGRATSKRRAAGDGLAIFVIPDEVEYVNRVRLEDVTDPEPHDLDADGFDIDAIIICGEEP
jgi:hypothetical protein